MNPYYEDNWTTIYHAHAAEVLENVQGEAVITDPPYANGTAYADYVDTRDNLKRLISITLPLIREAAPVALLTPGVANMYLYPEPEWVLCWHIPGGTGSGPWGFISWQPILAYGKDPYLSRGLGRRPDVLEMNVPSERKEGETNITHPVPKPTRVMKWLITRAIPEQQGTVIDPFMGSGTTLRAARELGYKSIGIDISEEYCEIAASRLSRGQIPMDMLNGTINTADQGLFR